MECAVCGLRLAERGRWCGECSARARWQGRELSDLVAHVRSQVVPFGATPTDSERVDSTGELKIPLRVAAVELADELFAFASGWVVEMNRCGVAGPVSPILADHVLTGIAPTKFPAGTDAFAAWVYADDVAAYLVEHHNELARHPRSGDYARELDRLTVRGTRAFPMEAAPPRPARGRLCPLCEGGDVEVVFTPSPGTRCRHCGEEQTISWAMVEAHAGAPR